MWAGRGSVLRQFLRHRTATPTYGLGAAMTAFSKANRDKPLMHTVAYEGVPMFRGLGLALDHAEKHGAKFAIFSADRRDRVLARFNKAHGTNLHGQQFLVDAHARDPAHFAIDASDAGKGNDLLAVLQHLGYHVTRPYALGSEAHHFIFTQSPVPVLEHWNVIPKGDH